MYILSMEEKQLFIPDTDNFSTYYIDILSMCRIDKKFLCIRHIDNLSICGIYFLFPGIYEHNFVYILYGKFVYTSYRQMFSLYYL